MKLESASVPNCAANQIPADFWLQRHLVANTNARCQTCLGDGFLEHGCFELDCWACDGSGKAGRRRKHLVAVGDRR
jgi:hypothetical protein